MAMCAFVYPRGLVPPSASSILLGIASPTLIGGGLATKRRVFFSFRFADIMRVNNVRNAWKITHPDSELNRSFCDSSLWERRAIEGADSVKRLIREGVEHTSVVCVLIGSDTWSRPWVKYEIARTVIDKRGLLGIHLNNLNHHQSRAPHPLGKNPLDFMGVCKRSNGSYYLYEKKPVVVDTLTQTGEWQWVPYADYTQPVPLPLYLQAPQVDWVMPLSAGTRVYDFVNAAGHKNIGAWVDLAARDSGR